MYRYTYVSARSIHKLRIIHILLKKISKLSLVTEILPKASTVKPRLNNSGIPISKQLPFRVIT